MVLDSFSGLGDLRRQFEIFRVHAFHDQFEQQSRIDARGGRRQRRLRRLLEDPIDLFFGQHAQGDETCRQVGRHSRADVRARG